jgi:hypothetical protein
MTNKISSGMGRENSRRKVDGENGKWNSRIPGTRQPKGFERGLNAAGSEFAAHRGNRCEGMPAGRLFSVEEGESKRKKSIGFSGKIPRTKKVVFFPGLGLTSAEEDGIFSPLRNSIRLLIAIPEYSPS